MNPSAETEYFEEVEAELKDLWMNDPPEMDHDEVITEDDLNSDRDGGAEISGGGE